MTDVLLVVALASVTLAFRIVPVLVGQGRGGRPETPAQSERQAPHGDLELLPLAVLSGLVVPGAFQVDPNNWVTGTVAAGAAVLVSVVGKRPPIGVVIGVSVAAAFISHVVSQGWSL